MIFMVFLLWSEKISWGGSEFDQSTPAFAGCQSALQTAMPGKAILGNGAAKAHGFGGLWRVAEKLRRVLKPIRCQHR
jgi:hypothetical protein